jgi:hypothetical protein
MQQRPILNKLTILLLGMAVTVPSFAQTPSTPVPLPSEAPSFTPREHAWTFGTSLRRLDIETDYDYKIHALAPYVDIGRGWVRPSWWSHVELNLMLGPNGQHLPDSPPLDFIGTGLRMRAGHTLPGQLLRKPKGDWGLELGLEYNEWIARSYSDRTLGDGSLSNSWVVRSRWIFIQPALFYSLWQPPRPQGNKPEWITTRIEGLVFSLGLSIPIQSEMQASYIRAGEKIGFTGRWRGTLAFLSLTSWLGI